MDLKAAMAGTPASTSVSARGTMMGRLARKGEKLTQCAGGRGRRRVPPDERLRPARWTELTAEEVRRSAPESHPRARRRGQALLPGRRPPRPRRPHPEPPLSGCWANKAPPLACPRTTKPSCPSGKSARGSAGPAPLTPSKSSPQIPMALRPCPTGSQRNAGHPGRPARRGGQLPNRPVRRPDRTVQPKLKQRDLRRPLPRTDHPARVLHRPDQHHAGHRHRAHPGNRPPQGARRGRHHPGAIPRGGGDDRSARWTAGHSPRHRRRQPCRPTTRRPVRPAVGLDVHGPRPERSRQPRQRLLPCPSGRPTRPHRVLRHA